MRLYLQLLFLVINTLFSSALNVSFQQAKRSLSPRDSPFSVSRHAALSNPNVLDTTSGNDTLDLNSVHDLIYLSNVSLGGNLYTVQLDTGSSDLWIMGPSSPLPNANATSTVYNLTYGIGWAFGRLSYAAAQFAGFSITSQVYLDVSNAQNPALGYGANGILGLGFTSLSTLDSLVNKTDESTGRSLLYNLFQENPSDPNFIAFSLQRASDPTDTIEGTFSIGEYEPQYAGVANATAIPTWPVSSPTRWNVLVDSFIVHGNTVPVTTQIQGAPANRAVALLDSGSSYSYVPKYVADAIYSVIAGASYDDDLGQWTVPCGVEVDMALQIAGQIFPIHPLDINPTSVTDPSTCVGSFLPQDLSVGDGQFDWLVGDNFLRNTYSVYYFGDFDSSNQMGNPCIKLYSVVDPDTASADFHQIRGGTPNTNITYNASGGSADTPTAVISLSDQVAKSLNLVGILFPAMLAIMALNGLVLLAIIIVGLVYCCRRQKGASVSRMTNSLKLARRRKTSGSFHRMSTMPINPSASVTGEPGRNHSYEPVSMSMTDDSVFNAPSPSFRKWDGDAMRPGVDRPRTMYTGASPIGLARSPTANYRASVARTEGITADMDYTPPSPGFFRRESPSRDSTLIDPTSPSAMAVSPPILHRASIAHDGSVPEATDYVPPPSPGFFQADEDGTRTKRTTLMTPPPPILVPPPSPSVRSHYPDTSRHSPLSASYTEDVQENSENTAPPPGLLQRGIVAPPQSPSIRSYHSETSRHSPLSEDVMASVETAPGFLQRGQESPIIHPSLPPPSRLPPPAPTGYRMSVARTEGLNGGMEFRRPTPGFMQGDRPRSLA